MHPHYFKVDISTLEAQRFLPRHLKLW